VGKDKNESEGKAMRKGGRGEGQGPPEDIKDRGRGQR
jgi:hypothetical protein